MRNVTFTQYLFPDRRSQEVTIALDEAVADKADALTGRGYTLEIECHPDTQLVHMTVSDPQEDVDCVARVCENGPGVPAKVVELIDVAFDSLVGGTA